MKSEGNREIAAAKAGMDAKTARKYLRLAGLPSELPRVRRWRTRPDPFAEVWEEARQLLEVNPGLEAKTVFEHLQRCHPGRFADGQLRTLQRRVKAWRATEGPAKEVFFTQQHPPGRLSASDFTHMDKLGVTIQGQSFPHLIYHFVLTYSNWETGAVCFSERFESLCEGLQNAVWELGKVPHRHRTDRPSTAVNNVTNPAEFTDRYQALLRYYGMEGEKIQARQAHENGDIEQRHYRFKRALEQELMLRGSRDFASVEDYQQLLKALFVRYRLVHHCVILELKRRLFTLDEPTRRLTQITSRGEEAVEKTLRGKVLRTFPLRLEIPQRQRDSHFPHSLGDYDAGITGRKK